MGSILTEKNPSYVSCKRLMKYKHEPNKTNKIVLNTEYMGNMQNKGVKLRKAAQLSYLRFLMGLKEIYHD